MFSQQYIPLLIIILVVVFHIIEVNLIDPQVTSWVGQDFANNLEAIEGKTVYWFSQNWIDVFVYFFVIIYIGIYPFTLWFSIYYFIFNKEKKFMKSLAYGLLLIYIISLPFYLFLPITNVYKFYNVSSALESVIPSVESFFYSTTTPNNCLPSLHTAMTILIAYCLKITGNKRLTYFGYIVMVCVILSVIYLSIHWITDVITGAVISVSVIIILDRFMREKKNERN
jgi:membrane-associated phospholipid phosphatase